MLKKTMLLFTAVAVIMVLALSACSGGWRESYEGFLDDLVGKVDVEKQLRNVDAEEVIRDKLNEYSVLLRGDDRQALYERLKQSSERICCLEVPGNVGVMIPPNCLVEQHNQFHRF